MGGCGGGAMAAHGHVATSVSDTPAGWCGRPGHVVAGIADQVPEAVKTERLYALQAKIRAREAAFNQHKDYAQRNMTYVRAESRGRQLFYAPREVVIADLTA